MKEKLVEYIKLVRLPGWGAYSIPAVFGALTTDSWNLEEIIILFFIGMLAAIFGFVLNDYADIKVDKMTPDLSARPLVKGTIKPIYALYLAISAAILHYIIVFIAMILGIFQTNIIAIIILTTAAFFSIIYNLYGKKIVGSDNFVAAATALYCLFGAFVVTNILTGLTWIVVIVTFIQVLYLNAIIGGIKDVDHDYKVGGKTFALWIGVRANKQLTIPISFKISALILRSLSAFFLFLPFFIFKDFNYEIWQPIIMILMFIGIYAATLKMLHIKIFDRQYLRKLISIQAFLRYSVVPVMLSKEIGYSIGLFLIIFPFIWFAIFNRLLYGKAVQPDTL